MSVCIHYSRPTSASADNEVFGFDVAVTNFLHAYFRFGNTQQFICRPSDADSFDHFKQLATANGIDAAKQCVGLDPRHPEKNLQSIACIFRPDPLIADSIWRRAQMRGHGYATCGLVHTMSGERITRAVDELFLIPSDSGDALICPSASIRDAVRNLWEIRADYMRHRFGATFSCPVDTPVIPLGIMTETFSALTAADKRKAQREILGVDENEIIALFVGRLSFATKAHPFALFQAAESAARRSGKKVRLIMYGYFKPLEMEQHFRDLARDIGRTVAIAFIMNDDKRFPDGLWAAADIFCSLSDNVQESFGLTPIEAMAAGLPAVISDWDGYREGVRNGRDGFLIPTTTPPPGAGMDIARFYYNQENYGIALSAIAQSSSVDIEACAHALTVLISDNHLRQQMGASGRRHAREVFDWQQIIPAYENLWRELAERRVGRQASAGVPEQWQAAHPGFPNPWQMFKSFPTTHLRATDILHSAASEEDAAQILRHEMNYYAPDVLIPKEHMPELIAIIRQAGSVHIGKLLAAFPTDKHDTLWRCIGWMLKFGICQLERPAA